MPIRTAVFTLFLSLLLTGTARAQEGPQGAAPLSLSADSLEVRVDSLMAEYDREDSPGAVVGVIRGGELVFTEGYGMANLAHGVPITTETRFNIGSVSKQFTGFAFALLAKRGKLSLDDPVTKYLPSLPEFEHTVTLRHLLTHTSGYREFFGPLALDGRKLASRDEALEVVRRQPKLEFPPGSALRYNASGYAILAEIAQRITGTPFPTWMKQNVFGPLDMGNTTIKSEAGEVMPRAASSYSDAADGNGYREPSMDNPYYGSTDVYTTARDLARWMRNFKSAELGGPAVQELMRRRFVLTSGDTTRYGLGLQIDRTGDLRRLSHGGTKEGFRAHLEYYPALKAGVVVMANYSGINAGRVAQETATIAFADHLPSEGGAAAGGDGLSFGADVLKRYAGTYRAETGATYVFTAKAGRLFMTPPEVDVRIPLTARSETRFQMPGESIQVRFHPGADGTVQRVTVHRRAPVSLRRAPSWQPSPGELKAYARQYYSREAGATYVVSVEDSQLVAEHRWIGKMELSPVAPETFASGISILKGAPPFRLQIRFERNAGGSVTRFHASIFRSTGIWFKKQK